MKRLLFSFILMSFLTGCGTVFSGNHTGYEEISISTNVKNPKVSINGNVVEVQNNHFLVNKDDDNAFVMVEADGYKTSNIYLKRNVRPAVTIFDTLLIVPLLIDLYNNEIYTFYPKNVIMFLSEEKK